MASISRKRAKQGTPAQHPRLSPAVVARCLKFTESAHIARFEKLQHRPITGTGCIHRPILDNLGIWEEVAQYMANANLGGFYTIRGPSYYELTMEFMTTFCYSDPATPEVKALKFRLLNKNFHMSVTEFNRTMGFYDDEYMATEAYAKEPLEMPLTFPDSRFWREVAPHAGKYHSSRAKASRLANPVLRYLHRYLALTLACRGESQGVVTKIDLFYLYCMVHNLPFNLGAFFATMLSLHCIKPMGELMMGTFITHLAIKLGVITEGDVFGQVEHALTKVCDMKPINEAYLLRMGMITKTADGAVHLIRMLEPGDGGEAQEVNDDQPDEGEPSHGPQARLGSAEYRQLRAQMDILNANQLQMQAQMDVFQDDIRNQLHGMNLSMQTYFAQFPPPPPPQ